MWRALNRTLAFFRRWTRRDPEGHQRLLPEINSGYAQLEPEDEPSDYSEELIPELKLLIGRVTSVMHGTVHINNRLSFCLDVVTEDFVPFKGDWLEVTYSMEPGKVKMKVHSVKPVNSKNVDQVSISSVHRRHGVIDNNIFFTLDSLKLPAGYVPWVHDVVNAVVVESDQSCYMWRAVSITPVHTAH